MYKEYFKTDLHTHLYIDTLSIIFFEGVLGKGVPKFFRRRGAGIFFKCSVKVERYSDFWCMTRAPTESNFQNIIILKMISKIYWLCPIEGFWYWRPKKAWVYLFISKMQVSFDSPCKSCDLCLNNFSFVQVCGKTLESRDMDLPDFLGCTKSHITSSLSSFWSWITR